MNCATEISQTARSFANMAPTFKAARLVAGRVEGQPLIGVEREERLRARYCGLGDASREIGEGAVVASATGWGEGVGFGVEGDASPLLSPRTAAATVSPRSARGPVSAPDDNVSGAELVRVETHGQWEVERRDTLLQDPGRKGSDGEVQAWGRRKRSVAWVREMGQKTLRRLSGWRRKSSEGEGRSDFFSAREMGYFENKGEGSSPLLAPSPQGDRVVDANNEAGSVPPSPPLWDHSTHPISSLPSSLRRGEDSPSSAYAVTSPNPAYDSSDTYLDALTSRVVERGNRGDFDSDVISFRFAGAAGNQDDGVSSLFYAGSLRSDVGSEKTRRSYRSEDALLDEIRSYGPQWARAMYRVEEE